MAREHQGLQIALIIFVMLTLILGVTTFIFFRRYDETVAELNTQTSAAQQARSQAETEQAQKIKLLKFLGGFPETEKIETIEEECRKDFTTYGDKFPEEQRTYRQLLKLLHEQIAELNKLYNAEQEKVQEFKNYNERRDDEVKVQIT
ncbi:MAG TPA: hypothetical protein PLQ00_12715, partial [Thermoguttaceae bacterium]|nr:hypothetical protein [Thermoguttaceae bacterium]